MLQMRGRLSRAIFSLLQNSSLPTFVLMTITVLENILHRPLRSYKCPQTTSDPDSTVACSLCQTHSTCCFCQLYLVYVLICNQLCSVNNRTECNHFHAEYVSQGNLNPCSWVMATHIWLKNKVLLSQITFVFQTRKALEVTGEGQSISFIENRTVEI